jgi:hypothetical protein
MGNLGDVFGGQSANDIEERSFDVLPMGDYTLVVTASETKTTKSGNGTYLSCTMEIVEGQHKGRKLFANFNIKNPNAEAVSIARAELAALCRAVRVPNPKDSSELHDKPFDARIGIEKRKDTGDSGGSDDRRRSSDERQEALGTMKHRVGRGPGAVSGPRFSEGRSCHRFTN